MKIKEQAENATKALFKLLDIQNAFVTEDEAEQTKEKIKKFLTQKKGVIIFA